MARRAGVVSEPELYTQPLDDSVKFLLVASAAVWAQVSAAQAIAAIGVSLRHGLDAAAALAKLLKKCRGQWSYSAVVGEGGHGHLVAAAVGFGGAQGAG